MNEGVTFYKKLQIKQELSRINSWVDEYPDDLSLDHLSDLGFVLEQLTDLTMFLKGKFVEED